MWKAAGNYVQGISHYKNNVPCQDFVYYHADTKIACVSLADGAGSAKHADIGAKMSTKKIVNLLVEHFELFYEADAIFVQKKIYHILQTNIGIIAKKNNSNRKDFASTLLFVAVKENKFIAGHIGDGIICYLKNDLLEIISPPDNGEFVNETYFTTSKNYLHHLRLFKGTLNGITGFALMSDGTCEGLFDKQNKKVAPIVKNIIEWLDTHTVEDVNLALRENLDKVIRLKTHDDCSMTILRDSNKLI